MKPLLCIAHRGGHMDDANSSLRPENSLAAFKYSLKHQVDGIEIDVWNIEGELLVMHDRRLGRELPGQGHIFSHSLQHLKSLSLKNGEPIPTLQQVLELIGNQCLLNIELKGPGTATLAAEALITFNNEHKLGMEHYIVSSFDQRQLQTMKTLLPEVKRGVLTDGVPLDYTAQYQVLAPYSIHLHLGACAPELVADAHARGYQVWAYTVNHTDEWQYLQQLGVDGVFTDYPQKLQAFNKEFAAAETLGQAD